jgi:hypothetical protein
LRFSFAAAAAYRGRIASANSARAVAVILLCTVPPWRCSHHVGICPTGNTSGEATIPEVTFGLRQCEQNYVRQHGSRTGQAAPRNVRQVSLTFELCSSRRRIHASSAPPCASRRSMRLRMSEHLHPVMFGPSFNGFGKRPFFTPAHQVDLLTGIIAGMGGCAFLSPIIWVSRR